MIGRGRSWNPGDLFFTVWCEVIFYYHHSRRWCHSEWVEGSWRCVVCEVIFYCHHSRRWCHSEWVEVSWRCVVPVHGGATGDVVFYCNDLSLHPLNKARQISGRKSGVCVVPVQGSMRCTSTRRRYGWCCILSQWFKPSPTEQSTTNIWQEVRSTMHNTRYATKPRTTNKHWSPRSPCATNSHWSPRSPCATNSPSGEKGRNSGVRSTMHNALRQHEELTRIDSVHN